VTGGVCRAPALLDCNVAIGRTAGNSMQGGRVIRTADLLGEMDRVGIAEALVYHVLSREYDPLVGNLRVLAELGERTRLHPVWAALPAHTGEFPRPKELMALMSEHDVRMVRVFPAADLSGQRFSLREWCAGELLGTLEDAAVPLALDFGLFRRAEPPWPDVEEATRLHPELKIILIGVQNRNNRSLYPLLERHPQLYIETGGYNVHNGIEHVVQTFGPHRIVFGTGFPRSSMGAARLQLDRAEIDDSERTLIGSTNLRRLLGRPDTEQAMAR